MGKHLFVRFSNERRRGEMYFYYFPKKILKVNPVNCYQVPDKFGIDEHSYNQSLEKLYRLIQSLNVIMVPKWTNITISIENGMFKIEYNYNEIEQSKYSDEEKNSVGVQTPTYSNRKDEFKRKSFNRNI